MGGSSLLSRETETRTGQPAKSNKNYKIAFSAETLWECLDSSMILLKLC